MTSRDPDYDSEREDNPRRVLNTDGYFRKDGATRPFVFKLEEFKPRIVDKNGKEHQPRGTDMIYTVRPVPNPILVQHAREVMCPSSEGQNGETAIWTATLNPPPSEPTASPGTLFAPREVNTATAGIHNIRLVPRRRYVSRIDSLKLKTMLITVSGFCIDNGPADSRAGWSFIFRPGPVGLVSGVLERQGPEHDDGSPGSVHGATVTRAEIRAAIAALEFRVWWGEGWERLIIASDSEYLVCGATSWMRTWAARGWRTSGGARVKNRDLWEKLAGLLEVFAEGGTEVSFWQIPKRWNVEAHRAAKEAAESGEVVEEFVKPTGVMV
ncbi:putative rnase h domain protein [Echria macrotheca]|uniref:ribonuclease H n=1 Tax=Echria macrotheca TaxID=438768 RepID=A0AAJ0B479_9PEZI|nr:putative rnase h domain protein [Echria macrotheca]